jgi:Uma2 family endonuclease
MTDLVLDPPQTPTELAPYTPTPFRFTLAEYHRLHQQGFIPSESRVELIEGVIIQMAPVGIEHVGMTNYFSTQLSRKLQNGEILSIQNPLEMGTSELIPDVMILRPEPSYYGTRAMTAADVLLLIEVSNTTLRYDTGKKLDLYATHLIPEYWVIDVEHQAVLQYWQPVGETYTQSRTVKSREIVTSLMIPYLTVTVEELLRVLPNR